MKKISLAGIIGVISFLVIGLLSGLSISLNSKKVDLENRLGVKTQDNFTLESRIDSLQYQVDLSHSQMEFKEKELNELHIKIDDLRNTILERETDIENLNMKIKIFEARIVQYQKEGMAEETKQFIEDLSEEINKARSERDEIRADRNRIIEEYDSLKELIQDRDNELHEIKNKLIPYLEKKVLRLDQELKVQKQINDNFNIRGHIDDVYIDMNTNRISFNLYFSEEDVTKLKGLGKSELTFSPIIENLNLQPFFQIAPDGPMDRAFKIQTANISLKTSFNVKIQSPILKSVYRKKDPINMQSGDPIKIEIKVDELRGLIVANTVFKLKR